MAKGCSAEKFDESSKIITNLITKLTEKEETWGNIVKDLQELIGTKLDKDEVAPVQEYMDHKIHKLQ